MILASLRKNNQKVVGLKQTMRAAQQGSVAYIFLAADADDVIREKIENLCTSTGIELIHVESKAKLGEACGIDVGSATAALLK